MRVRTTILNVLIACTMLALGACASAPCELRGAGQVLSEVGAAHEVGAMRLVRWDVADDPVLWSRALPPSRALAAFRAEARRRTGGQVDAKGLIVRSRDDPALAAERPINERVLALADARVVPMRCFDALFLARQAERLDMVATPSEVLVAVLRSRDGARLRLIELTVNQPGIGRLSPVSPHIDEAVAAGWRFWAVFHNHNFFFDGAGWRGGSVAPSGPDAQVSAMLAREAGLAEIWITNGFSTLVLPTTELP